MPRWLPLLFVATCLTLSGHSSRPDFQITPEVPAMPKAEDYQKMIAVMDQTAWA